MAQYSLKHLDLQRILSYSSLNIFTNLSLYQNIKKINRGRGDGWLTFKTWLKIWIEFVKFSIQHLFTSLQKIWEMENIWNISWNQFYIVSTFKHWWNSIQAPLWCLWGLNSTGRGALPLSCSWIQFNVCDQTYSRKNLRPWEEKQPPWFSDDLTYRNQMSDIPLFPI